MIECINQNQLKSWEKSTKLAKPKNHNQINFNSFCFVDFIYLRKLSEKNHHELFLCCEYFPATSQRKNVGTG